MAQVEMEPVFLEPLGGAGDVDGANFTGLLAVELVANNATQAAGADHLVASSLGFLEVGYVWNGDRFEGIDLVEQLNEVTDIRLAELGHGNIQITALTFAMQ